MNQETLIFGDIKMDKSKFHYPKNLVLIDELYIEKVLIFNKVYFGKKGYEYFTGYKYDNYKIKALSIKFPRMSGYVKSFDETKYISFFKDDKLINGYKKI